MQRRSARYRCRHVSAFEIPNEWKLSSPSLCRPLLLERGDYLQNNALSSAPGVMLEEDTFFAANSLPVLVSMVPCLQGGIGQPDKAHSCKRDTHRSDNLIVDQVSLGSRWLDVGGSSSAI